MQPAIDPAVLPAQPSVRVAAVSMPAAAIVLVAVGAWCVAHPYRSLTHDAIFYAGEALQRLQSGILRADPFFANGSQGDFSAFITPYAWLTARLGHSWAALVVAFLGRLVWLTSWWVLCASAFRRPEQRVARACAFAVPLLLTPFYEPFRIFAYAEPLATPRPWAEAACLLALAAAIRNRTTLAVFLGLLGLLIHPLMALPVLVLLAVRVATALRTASRGVRRAVVLAAVVAAAALIGAAFSGLPPFDRLLQRYDEAWWSVVAARNAGTTVQAWSPSDFMRLGGWLVLLMAALRHLSPAEPLHRLGRTFAITMGLCIGAWVLASSVREVLIVQLQVWRVLWLLQLLVPLVWVGALAARRAAGASTDPLVVALSLALMVSATWNALVLAALLLLVDRAHASTGQRGGQRTLRLGAGIAVGLVALAQIASWPALIAMHDINGSASGRLIAGLAAEPAVWFLLFGLVYLVKVKAKAGHSAALHTGILAGAAFFSAAAAAHWLWLASQRASLDEVPPAMVELRKAIPVHATVYSQGSLTTTWLQLHRPSYANQAQGASALFTRSGSLELQRRFRVLRDEGLTTGPDAWPADEPASAPKLDERRARRLCRDPALDVVVLSGAINKGAEAPITRQPFSLVMCEAVRSHASSPSSSRLLPGG